MYKRLLLTGIKNRLLSEMSGTVRKKVYILTNKLAIPESYHLPYVCIVYNGGKKSGGSFGGITKHSIDIYIFQAIRNEEKVLLGSTDNDGENRGLVDLCEDAETALLDYQIPEVVNGSGSKQNFLSDITDYYGPEPWQSANGQYSASMGFNMNYGVNNG